MRMFLLKNCLLRVACNRESTLLLHGLMSASVEFGVGVLTLFVWV